MRVHRFPGDLEKKKRKRVPKSGALQSHRTVKAVQPNPRLATLRDPAGGHHLTQLVVL